MKENSRLHFTAATFSFKQKCWYFIMNLIVKFIINGNTIFIYITVKWKIQDP